MAVSVCDIELFKHIMSSYAEKPNEVVKCYKSTCIFPDNQFSTFCCFRLMP